MTFTVNGREYGLTTFTAESYAMPHSVLSSEGGVFEMSFSLATNDWRVSHGLMGQEATLEGFESIQVDDVQDSNYSVSLGGTGEYRGLVQDGSVASASSSINNVSRGFPIPVTTSHRAQTQHDAGFSCAPVLFGDTWLLLKQYASAFKVTFDPLTGELDSNENRPLHHIHDDVVISRNIGRSLEDTADIVKLATYEYHDFRSKWTEIYPKYSPDLDPISISAEAGETVVTDVEVDFHIDRIEDHLDALDFVHDREYTYGVYSVIGNDDLPIKPAQFYDYGGSLNIERVPFKPNTIRITFVGPQIQNLGPFTVAMSSGEGNNYNSLHIMGMGVGVIRNEVEIQTGASSHTGEPVVQEVDNPYVCTPRSIANAMIDASRGYSGGVYSLSLELKPQGTTLREGDFIWYENRRWRIDSLSESPEVLSVSCSEHIMIEDLPTILDTMGADHVDGIDVRQI